MAEDLPDETHIITAAYEDRIKDLFKAMSEAVYTGEPEREAATRFRRGLISARRAYAAAIETMKEAGTL